MLVHFRRPLTGLIARGPPEWRVGVPLAMCVALLLLLAPVAARADHMTPGYQPAEVNGKTIPPRWGTPGPDRLGGSGADHCSGKEQRGTRNLLRYLEYWWPRGESWGIYNCRLPSLHSEGRAVDYHLDVRSERDRKAGYAISRFFRSKDSGGARWAMGSTLRDPGDHLRLQDMDVCARARGLAALLGLR